MTTNTPSNILSAISTFAFGLLGNKVPSFVVGIANAAIAEVEPLIDSELTKVGIEPAEVADVVVATLTLVNGIIASHKAAVSVAVAVATAPEQSVTPHSTTQAV